ncbi:hypothetical protein TRVL_07665 [Trypanosoma vivax]|nr:hypothetical protein TRVL_07665 [Trypanosoma vivax]
MGTGSRCAVLRFICGHALGNAKQYHERNVLAANVCRDRREVNAAQATTKQRCLMSHRCSQLCIAIRVKQRRCKARGEKMPRSQMTRPIFCSRQHTNGRLAGGLSGAHGCSARKKVPARPRMRHTVRTTNHHGILIVIVDDTRGVHGGICYLLRWTPVAHLSRYNE